MKKILITALAMLAAMLLIPLSALEEPEKISVAAPITPEKQSQEIKKTEIFRVYNTETETITELSRNDYIFGVVAAEMPALYHEEALKAQAIAAYTFATTRKTENADKDYDITTSPLTDQSFITKEAAAEKWGENASVYIAKIEKAIADTEGILITHEEKPITAVYHALSSGKTESAADIWGVDIPYLVPVPSEDDILAENYCQTVTLTPTQLAECLNLPQTDTITFSEPLKTASGAVKEITVGNKTLKGSEIREFLNLRSANFTVTHTESGFTFTVYGYGHGVGMSQHGANKMAEKGSSFEEILKHYYTGCELTSE